MNMKRMMKCLCAVAILFAQSGFAAQADSCRLQKEKDYLLQAALNPLRFLSQQKNGSSQINQIKW